MSKITTASEFGNFETCIEGDARELWHMTPFGAKRITWDEWKTEELIKLLGGIVPQEVETSMGMNPDPTTNLDFWQAYQAMRRGEWVGNTDTVSDSEHHYQLNERGRLHYVDATSDFECEIESIHLNSKTWYIVPKGPRYKVGDRFCFTDLKTETILEIVYCNAEWKEYAVTKTINKVPQGLDVFAEHKLDKIQKV